MAWLPPPQHDVRNPLRPQLPVEAWRAAVLEIAERHELPTGELYSFASGSDVVWAVGECVVKLTAPHWTSEIDTEARSLASVEGKLPVATPRVLARGELAGWPYVAMTRVPGVALAEVWPGLGHPERVRLATDLGALVRELHGLDTGAQVDDWDRFWRTCRTDVGRRLERPGVPVELAREVDPFLASVGELETGGRVFLHTELLDQHVLVEQRDGRFELCALIDFADSRIGPAEYDFPAPVEFIFRGERGLLAAFLEAHGSPADEALAERRLAWALSHRFGNLERLLRAVAPRRPGSLPELARMLFAS